MASMSNTITDVRKYWDSRPCNVKHSAKPVGTREYWDEVERRKYFVEPHIPSFAQFTRWHGRTVLEVGCGLGTDTINFARAGAVVTAIDLSPVSVSMAQQRMTTYGYDIDICVGDMERLEIPERAYDLVYCFGALHHTPRPELALEQFKRYMGPSSELRIMVYNRGSYKVLKILADNDWDFENVDALVRENSEAQTGCPVTHTFTRDILETFLRVHGYEVMSIDIEHIFRYDVEAYKRYEYMNAPEWHDVPFPLFRKLEKTIGWHLLVTARLA